MRSTTFPEDPNAPGTPATDLDRALAQLALIGPEAGEELRQLVYGTEER